MSVTDANPPHPTFVDDYVLREVDAEWLTSAVKPKQFIHIDQSECIMCEGCVDICPWKCIHMVSPEAISESVVAFGRTLSGIPFGAPRRQLSDMFFLVLARDSRTHLQILARLGRLMQTPRFVDDLRSAETSSDAFVVICEADAAIGG